MAMIQCKECNHEISDKANICPYCGVETEFNKIKKSNIRFIIYIIIALLIISSIVYCFRMNDPIYKLSREATCILESYQKGEITNREVTNKIDNLENRARGLGSTGDYLSLTIKLHDISYSFSKIVSNDKINEYIKELKQF